MEGGESARPENAQLGLFRSDTIFHAMLLRAWLSIATGCVSRLLAGAGSIALFAIMAMTAADVLNRALRGTSIPGVIESSEVMLVFGAFLGLAYAQRAKTHVSTNILIERLPARLATVFRVLGLVILAAFVGWAAYLSGLRALDSFRTGEARFGLIEIVQWPARAAIALGFGALTAEVVRDLFVLFWGRSRDEPRSSVSA